MFPSLETKLRRFEELEQQLQDPAVLSNTERLIAVQREYGGLQKVAHAVRRWRTLSEDVAAAEAMCDEEADPQSRAYAQAELDQLAETRTAMQAELEELALSGDSITRGGLIMEIRAGTGGEEAALFARDLFEMYERLIDRRGWKFELIDASPS
ncbi:MAG: PCRF domain-containing protein, partial [Planctomycetaceae bacterium]